MLLASTLRRSINSTISCREWRALRPAHEAAVPTDPAWPMVAMGQGAVDHEDLQRKPLACRARPIRALRLLRLWPRRGRNWRCLNRSPLGHRLRPGTWLLRKPGSLFTRDARFWSHFYGCARTFGLKHASDGAGSHSETARDGAGCCQNSRHLSETSRSNSIIYSRHLNEPAGWSPVCLFVCFLICCCFVCLIF